MGGLIMDKLHYIGMLVDLRPASGKSYIVWDLNTNKKFANENFKSVQEAIDFCHQNRMVINRVVPSRNGYTNVLVSTTGTTIDLTETERILSKAWTEWKNHSMTTYKDKAQMRRDIMELIDIMLD